ncbi:MAG: acyl carrier protein [Candidatus Riflebacteria bacterium]|nr:acyl carrier protein [Candidatus Riflebacteria bacterium]
MPKFEDLRDMLADIASLDPEVIEPDSAFFDDLGIETVMIMEFMNSLENKYGIQIPESDVPKINSISQLIRYINSKSN